MKTILLAGGLGSRLAEETVAIPKPMVEVGGRLGPAATAERAPHASAAQASRTGPTRRRAVRRKGRLMQRVSRRRPRGGVWGRVSQSHRNEGQAVAVSRQRRISGKMFICCGRFCP